MTLLEEINNITWVNLPNKLKSVLKRIVSSIGTSGVEEAPIDSQKYVRKNADWEVLSVSGSGVQSVTGTFVSNSDPSNPVISVPNAGNSTRGTQSISDYKKLNNVQQANDDGEALSLGVAVGEFYHTNGILKINLGAI